MSKIYIIASREFIETVRTKAFLFGAVFMPMIMVGLIFGMQKISKLTEPTELPDRKLAVIDFGHGVVEGMRSAIDAYNAQNPKMRFVLEAVPAADDNIAQVRADLNKRAVDEQIYGYVEVPPTAISGDEPVKVGRKDAKLSSLGEIRDMVRRTVTAIRFSESGVDAAKVLPLLRPVEVESIDVRAGAGKKENEMARIMTPFVFMFFLWMGTLGISQGLLTSLLEEKSSRIVEVLLSAVSPMQLMAGKILGAVCVGLLLMGIWAIAGALGARYFEAGSAVSLMNIGYLVLYFFPAFLFSAALMGAIGSACNTLKEAQSLSTPVTIFNIVPLMLWLPLTQAPQSMFAILLSFFPPITPFVMVLRLCSDPNIPMWQIVGSLVVLWLGVFAAIWFSAKVFRIGILMYGKAPTMAEMIRWARYA